MAAPIPLAFDAPVTIAVLPARYCSELILKYGLVDVLRLVNEVEESIGLESNDEKNTHHYSHYLPYISS